jgi:hypothetical protein
MRLACNAPLYLWDEFMATAAFLTNVTGSTTIGGKTPSERWFGKPPSLSNLREIGCKAFALIPTNNPKLLQRSLPLRPHRVCASLKSIPALGPRFWKNL